MPGSTSRRGCIGPHSSPRWVSRPSVTVYGDDDYHGATQYLDIGEYDTAQLSTLGYYNAAQLNFPGTLSSLKVAPGWTVTLYSGANFTGDFRVITSDKDLWRSGDFNDQTSSTKVEGPAL